MLFDYTYFGFEKTVDDLCSEINYTFIVDDQYRYELTYIKSESNEDNSFWVLCKATIKPDSHSLNWLEEYMLEMSNEIFQALCVKHNMSEILAYTRKKKIKNILDE